jgi:hypothetical protein
MPMRGQVLFTFYLRGENLPPLTPGLTIMLVAHDKTTGMWSFYRDYKIYGINLKPDGYTPITLPLDAPWAADTHGPELIFQWNEAAPAGTTPAIFVDKAEISTPTFDSPLITQVMPDKIHYKPGDKVTVTTSLVNPLGQPVDLTLNGQESWGITSTRQIFTQKLTLAAGEQKDVSVTYVLGPEEYGREIRVAALVDGKEVSSGRDFFGVSVLPLWVTSGSSGDRSYRPPLGDAGMYVGPGSGADAWRNINYSRRFRHNYCEFFSWSPGDITDQDPQQDPFPGGEGRLTLRSKVAIQQQTAMLKSVGFWPVSYVNGSAWADSGYKLFQQHPEWFLYDANGEVADYEMDGREKFRHIYDYDFDPNTYTHIFFQGVLNHALPQVQQFIANQYIKCGQDMGFSGVRMDVRYLEVYPGERDYTGKIIAETYPEADKISAANVHNVKALVHKVLPDFSFGYNYASPEETKDMRQTFIERCEGGAWMLDEIPCTYQDKTSPYHVWSVYIRRMCSWSDQVRKWGGVYNPYDFARGSMPYQIDLIYSAIFRIICGGHDYGGWYYNSRLPLGDFGAFTTRFSRILMSTDCNWISDLKDEVEVTAPAEIWWKDMCFWNKSEDGKKQLIVHLVNPPKVSEVNENPQSLINPPVHDITVTCAPQAGAKPTAAYLLMSEPMEPTDLNNIQIMKLDMHDAPGGKVSVTVPSVLFWKTVVFQW